MPRVQDGFEGIVERSSTSHHSTPSDRGRPIGVPLACSEMSVEEKDPHAAADYGGEALPLHHVGLTTLRRTVLRHYSVRDADRQLLFPKIAALSAHPAIFISEWADGERRGRAARLKAPR